MFNKVIIKGSIPLKSWFIHTETKKICNDNLALAADTVMQTFGKVPPPPPFQKYFTIKEIIKWLFLLEQKHMEKKKLTRKYRTWKRNNDLPIVQFYNMKNANKTRMLVT